MLASKSRGSHAWRPIESIHFQTRIVGERRHARCSTNRNCFQPGIANECVCVFDNIGKACRARLQIDNAAHQIEYFCNLVRVG
jgi:hypothetical protein